MRDGDIVQFATKYAAARTDFEILGGVADEQTIVAVTRNLSRNVRDFLETFPREDYERRFPEIYRAVGIFSHTAALAAQRVGITLG
jgi:hypothetical protein